MTTIELLTDVLGRNIEMLKSAVADFTDAEMFTRPVPGANHVAWQLGHLAISEAWMRDQFAPGATKGPPADFAAKFTKGTANIDDPSAFPSKAQIVETLSQQRAATIAWARTLSAADLDKPSSEQMKNFAPTLGHMLAMCPVHDAMHLGQCQVLRRKLGRPVMF